jgi:UDP-N-acetylmuramate--alanine ligase
MKAFHFVGIGGIGMSALARLMLARGHVVTGSDRARNDQVIALQGLGVPVAIGHEAGNLVNPDQVVISAAVGPDNPEVQAAHHRNIQVIRRSDLLATVMNAGTGVAIAGTHGKTTTTALVGHILVRAGCDPTILVGGISQNLGSNARIGGDTIVVEADEYDATFHKLEPTIAVITNVFPEHLDFYHTPDRVYEAFRTFARSVTGTLVVCADDPGARAAAQDSSARVVTYGTTGGDWKLCDVHESDGSMGFVVEHGGSRCEYTTQLMGLHNARNSVAAIAVASTLGASKEVIADAVGNFTGVSRRSEHKGEERGVLVLDDYAVHPNEVRATLLAMKSRYRRPLRVIFQPHTFSRTRDFLDDFAASFGDASAVYVMDIYPARETNTLGMSGPLFAETVSKKHETVRYTATAQRTLDTVVEEARSGDVIVTMGAGDVTLLGPLLLERLQRS